MELKIENKTKTRNMHPVLRKILGLAYLLLLLVFEIVVVLLDIIPTEKLLALFLLLAVLSAAIAFSLFSKRPSNRIREIVAVLATTLMIFFGVGINYIFGTLHFLEFVSVGKEASESVTEKSFNVYISGVDTWDYIRQPGRSDVNMLVTVNPKTHTVLLTSIPRDYQINLVDHDFASDKLTHTGMMGIATTMSSVEELLDVKIDYYVRVNFSTVIQLVNALGGIDVVADEPFSSHYGGDYNEYEFVEGVNHLNGRQALAFARERKAFLLGDRTRIENQQRVVKAILNKMTSARSMLLKYKTVLNSIIDYMQTDLSSEQIRALIKYQLAYNDKWDVKMNSVSGSDGREATYSGAASYIMLQDEESISKAHDLITEISSAGFEQQ